MKDMKKKQKIEGLKKAIHAINAAFLMIEVIKIFNPREKTEKEKASKVILDLALDECSQDKPSYDKLRHYVFILLKLQSDITIEAREKKHGDFKAKFNEGGHSAKDIRVNEDNEIIISERVHRKHPFIFCKKYSCHGFKYIDGFITFFTKK